ncbi:MAG: glycosyltransferase [Chthoniobacterales bacterium]|nr:glycosyltransferase [Chthoniobacterales bacterium]
MQKLQSGGPRKIAFVFTSMPVGGAEDFALAAGARLSREFEAHYVCLREYGRLGEEAKKSGRSVHVVPVFASRWITPWSVRRFASWLREENFSLVHSQTYHAHVFATKAARLARIPSVVHQQKTLEKLPWRRGAIFRACLARASRVVALSPRTAEDLARTHNVQPGKISVVANGIEKTSFLPAADRTALRRSLGLPPDGLLVGTVGRLHPEKSHETTIAAVAEVRRMGASVTAVLVGEGNIRGDLERFARESGVSDAIVFTGARRPAVPWFQALDIFVLASVWEGQPLALLQAVACGIPALASKIEGNTAVLGRDHPGLFAPRDAGSLAELMIAASRGPEFPAQLRESQTRVKVPWSEDSARELAAIYGALLS